MTKTDTPAKCENQPPVTLLEICQDLRTLATHLEAISGTIFEQELRTFTTIYDPSQDEPKPADFPPKDELPWEETPAITPTATKEQVFEAFKTLAKAGHSAEAKTLLQKYGAPRVSAIKPEHFDAILKELEAIK